MKGMQLADLDQRPSVEAWLAEELGLDDYAGDSVRVRVQVELLPDERPQPEPDAPTDP